MRMGDADGDAMAMRMGDADGRMNADEADVTDARRISGRRSSARSRLVCVPFRRGSRRQAVPQDVVTSRDGTWGDKTAGMGATRRR